MRPQIPDLDTKRLGTEQLEGKPTERKKPFPGISVVVTYITNQIRKVREPKKKELSPEVKASFLNTLKSRFERHHDLHPKIKWEEVASAIEMYPEILWSLHQLESTGGEPDVIGQDRTNFIFGDCSLESPPGRRMVMYDGKREAQDAPSTTPVLHRNEGDPTLFEPAPSSGNAIDLAIQIGAELMDHNHYGHVQEQLHVDQNSTSWIQTPPKIRQRGVALISSGQENTYTIFEGDVHSYNDEKGFRCIVKVPKPLEILGFAGQ